MRQSGRINRMNTKKKMLLAFLGSLCMTALYFLWAYQTFPFVYDINDDVAMRNVAAGVITGRPDAHLIHIKYVLGLCISALYRLFPGFDWYGVVMAGIICLGLAALLYRGLTLSGNFWKKLLWVSFVLLGFTWLGLRHLACFQWTVAAGVAGGAGLFLFAACQSGEAFQAWVEEGVSAFLLLLCLCIRDDVFLLVLPAAALLFWGRHGKLARGKRLPVFLAHWQMAAALAGGILLIWGVEAFAYGSPQWREFLAYNRDREAMMDFYGIPDYAEDEEFYQSLGMSEETVVNLHRYSLYLVEDIYSEKMHLLAERAKELYLQENPPLKRLTDGISKVYGHLSGAEVLPVTAAVSALLAALWMLLRKKQEPLSLFTCLNLLFGAYWLYLGYRGRVVERVVYTLLFLQIFTYLGMLLAGLQAEEADAGRPEALSGTPEERRTVKMRWQDCCLAGLLGICLLAASCGQVKRLRETSAQRRDYNQQFLEINRYMAEHRENVYFMTTFSIETYTDNFTLRRELPFTNLLSVGGWHSFSELENKKIEALGIQGQTMEHAMLTEGNAYVISLVNVDYMDRYFTAKYGAAYQGRQEVDVQAFGGTDFYVYRFILKGQGEKQGGYGK